jgi:L-threonylcarbamoyladenylate synthase
MITDNIDLAVKALNKEQIVAIPTETVYGLAGSAFNEEALKKIFILKRRPFYNPLIVHLKSSNSLKEVARDIPESAWKLAEKFWPGALTLVLKRKEIISDLVTAGKDTVAIRVPNHPMALAVLNKLEFPLAAPSANPFGSISPTDASHVENYFKNRLEIILDGGSCEKGVESTIVGFENNQATLYRYGSISVEEIEAVVGPLLIAVNKNSEPNAPGMLSRHYAPQTETFLTNRVLDLMQSFPEKRIGILAFKDTMLLPEGCVQEILSATGDLHEAAQKLYAALHRLDKSDMDLIIAERLPDYGLGKTINDRLERATKKMKK